MNTEAVMAMRERKYRKEKPFAIMVRKLEDARALMALSSDAEALLTSTARPIVLAPAKRELAGVAPDNNELGVMLPYTPLHHLLFAAGAPEILVMTSANRSSEPIAYEDGDAIERLGGIADAFLIGERPIARRVDDSVARAGALGPSILRRARGYAPGAVTSMPCKGPILAIGADLKNTVTLVVDGQAFGSQHIGDLEHYQAHRAFAEVIEDLLSMYDVNRDDLLIAHDAHPQYLSTAHALTLPAREIVSVQHHRAHIASVLAERGEWEKHVLGVSFDGTGYGDDGTIWGGEIFAGSVKAGFTRIAHLRRAALPGGDAAARYPVQAATGFLSQLESLPNMLSAPFGFDNRYTVARQLVDKDVRSFATTSMGRLFDTAAALLGFTREVTFEGQAAMWLEQIARSASNDDAYPFPLIGDELNFRVLLGAVICDRVSGRSTQEIARAFQRGIAQGLGDALKQLGRAMQIDTVVLSGGVFQNELLLEDLKSLLADAPLTIWTNHAVPANDGGISLGQAALAAFIHQDQRPKAGEQEHA
jgi:hydrogenase maturation protein HypF